MPPLADGLSICRSLPLVRMTGLISKLQIDSLPNLPPILCQIHRGFFAESVTGHELSERLPLAVGGAVGGGQGADAVDVCNAGLVLVDGQQGVFRVDTPVRLFRAWVLGDVFQIAGL